MVISPGCGAERCVWQHCLFFFFFSGVYKPTFVPLAGSVPTPVLGYSARVFVAGFVVHTFMIRGVSVVRNIFDLGMHDVRILLPDAA